MLAANTVISNKSQADMAKLKGIEGVWPKLLIYYEIPSKPLSKLNLQLHIKSANAKNSSILDIMLIP